MDEDADPGAAAAARGGGGEGDVLFAYVLPVVGTVPGTAAGQVAATAVHDALAVAAARGALAPADPALGAAWRLALARNEALRQLRARAVFVDTRADVWLPEGDRPADLVAAAYLGLPPGDRDVLALGWVGGLTPLLLARACGLTEGAVARRTSGARDALAREAGAVMLAADPGACPDLLAVLAAPEPAAAAPEVDVLADGVPADGVPEDGAPEDGVHEDGVPEDVPEDGGPLPLTPGRRDRIDDHARGCRVCAPRRRAMLEAALPGFGLPGARTLPPRPAAGGGLDPVVRAAAWDDDGFPVPLDREDARGTQWLRRAIIAGAASAALLLLGSLLYLALT